MITFNELKIGNRVVYDDTSEKVNATVINIDHEIKSVRFVDNDGFEWEEPFKDIPSTVKSIIK